MMNPEMSPPEMMLMPPVTQEIMVHRQMSALEAMCSIEAPNRYTVSDQSHNVEFLIVENSECFERICCNVNRGLTMRVFEGKSTDTREIAKMDKDCHTAGCGCIRPKLTLKDMNGQVLGYSTSPDAPCCSKACCHSSVELYRQDKKVFVMENKCINPALAGCPCLLSEPAIFKMYRPDSVISSESNHVAELVKWPVGCCEHLTKQSKTGVRFMGITDPVERGLLLNSAILMDLEYFPAQNGGGGGN